MKLPSVLCVLSTVALAATFSNPASAQACNTCAAECGLLDVCVAGVAVPLDEPGERPPEKIRVWESIGVYHGENFASFDSEDEARKYAQLNARGKASATCNAEVRETGQARYQDPCKVRDAGGVKKYKCPYSANYECLRRPRNPAYDVWLERKRKWKEYEKEQRVADGENRKCERRNRERTKCMNRCEKRCAQSSAAPGNQGDGRANTAPGAPGQQGAGNAATPQSQSQPTQNQPTQNQPTQNQSKNPPTTTSGGQQQRSAAPPSSGPAQPKLATDGGITDDTFSADNPAEALGVVIGTVAGLAFSTGSGSALFASLFFETFILRIAIMAIAGVPLMALVYFVGTLGRYTYSAHARDPIIDAIMPFKVTSRSAGTILGLTSVGILGGLGLITAGAGVALAFPGVLSALPVPAEPDTVVLIVGAASVGTLTMLWVTAGALSLLERFVFDSSPAPSPIAQRPDGPELQRVVFGGRVDRE